MYNFTDGELLTAKKLNDTFLECRTEAIDNSLVVCVQFHRRRTFNRQETERYLPRMPH
nr:MAG TPA: hypothetical protein [Caudoviricetes sp.]